MTWSNFENANLNLLSLRQEYYSNTFLTLQLCLKYTLFFKLFVIREHDSNNINKL